MSIRAVTFDAASTLIRVTWRPGPFAVDCLNELGIEVDPQPAIERYERLYLGRLPEYIAANAARDVAACRSFWRGVSADWLPSIGVPVSRLAEVLDVADKMLYSGNGRYFAFYEDVKPAVIELSCRGLRLAIISNWDYSLHRIVDSLGGTAWFDPIVASLLEGVEKPDRRLFDLTLSKMGLQPDEVLHVGDNPIDDVQGALGAGLRAVLLDREANQSQIPADSRVIQSLTQLPEVLDWTD